jgi:subtilisin family serine protease
MAPGVHIRSTFPGGQYISMSGTSFATPFMTGTISLLWSLFPTATPTEIMFAVLNGASSHRLAIIPPLLNAETALGIGRNCCNG